MISISFVVSPKMEHRDPHIQARLDGLYPAFWISCPTVKSSHGCIGFQNEGPIGRKSVVHYWLKNKCLPIHPATLCRPSNPLPEPIDERATRAAERPLWSWAYALAGAG